MKIDGRGPSMKVGERFFAFVTLCVTFSYATPASWKVDAATLLGLLCVGAALTLREEAKERLPW